MTAACWVPAFADGTHAVMWPNCAVRHWPSEQVALDRIRQLDSAADVTPTQLDQPCVTMTCGVCNDTYDGDSTIHFESLDEAHEVLGECGGWTVLPDGSYRCDICQPTDRMVVEAVASRV